MDNKNRFTHGRTSVYNLNYHIIWGTKYRNKVLSGDIEDSLKRILLRIAEEYGFSIAHMEVGLDNHIHLLVSALRRKHRQKAAPYPNVRLSALSHNGY